MIDVRTPARTLANLLLLVVTSCTAGSQILEVEPAPDTTDPVGPYRISATVSQASTVRDLSVFWTAFTPSSDGNMQQGEIQRARMSQETEGFFEGAIPGQPNGSRIEYFLELRDVTGSRVREPRGSDVLTFHVLNLDGGAP